MKHLLLLIPFVTFGQNQLEDSLIALSERMPDTSFTSSYRWDNYKYEYAITNNQRAATFELISKQKLYTDWRKIGGLSYFFGAWGLMLGHDAVQMDKVKHFTAGYAISMGSYLLLRKTKRPILKSNLIAILAGGLKEGVYDWYLKKGTPSIADGIWTGIGGFYGGVTIPMIKTKPCKPMLLN